MSSLYAKLIDVIERQITPMAGAIGQQKYVTSIRDGFITALPFMIVGSFLLVFIFPPFSPDTTWGFARAWLQFSLDHRDALMLPFNFSMGVMTLFIAVGIAATHTCCDLDVLDQLGEQLAALRVDGGLLVLGGRPLGMT